MTTFFAARCPTCGYVMDAHSAVGDEDAVPSAGDRSVCLACGALAIYETVLGTLRLRLPSHDETEESLGDPTLVFAMFAHRQARAENLDEWPRGPKETAS